MAARRCSTCGISYPDDYRFHRCPFHEAPTAYIQADVDEDWEQRLKFLVLQREITEQDSELIPTIETKVVHADGQLWVDSREVIRSGIKHRLEADSLIRIGKQYFEIQGYDAPRRRYLVEPFSMELSDEDLARLGG